jgi:uncharacterized iron-regulated membrane protein
MSRRAWTLTHRYVGLVIAGFLIVAGATGSVLAFREELDAAVNPGLFRVEPPADGARPMEQFALREILLARYPDWSIDFVNLAPIERGAAVWFTVEGGPGGDGQVFVNPYTAEVLGSRSWGDLSQGRRNLVPFIYDLHYALALGVIGTYAFGIVALLWTLDCFVGLRLTFPPLRRSRATEAQQGWWARWKLAWLVRWRAGGTRFNFDLHRAGGLWVWAMLLVFAWSSVAFNLRDVYDPVMRSVTDFPDEEALYQPLPVPLSQPALRWDDALDRGRAHLASIARERGFVVHEEHWFGYEAEFGLYSLSAITSLDVGRELPRTQLWFDGSSGELRRVRLPTGAHSGTTISSWLYALHMAKVWGLPFRLFVCLLGLLIAGLSVTGVVIWLHKRAARGAMRVSARASRSPYASLPGPGARPDR